MKTLKPSRSADKAPFRGPMARERDNRERGSIRGVRHLHRTQDLNGAGASRKPTDQAVALNVLNDAGDMTKADAAHFLGHFAEGRADPVIGHLINCDETQQLSVAALHRNEAPARHLSAGCLSIERPDQRRPSSIKARVYLALLDAKNSRLMNAATGGKFRPGKVRAFAGPLQRFRIKGVNHAHTLYAHVHWNKCKCAALCAASGNGINQR